MRSPRAAWFYGSAIVALALDQVTKAAARSALSPGRPRTLVPGFLSLDLSFNTGGAFGLLPDWAPLFIIAALAAVFAIVRLSRKGFAASSLATGLGLLMGGALGNLADRLLSPAREVTDFISVQLAFGARTYAWPTFNIADSAIVIGAILVLLNVYVIDKARGGD